MTRADELRERQSGHRDAGLLEGDALVGCQDAGSHRGLAGPVADTTRDLRQLVTLGLALADLTSKAPVRLHEEIADVEGLEAARVGPLELVADDRHLGRV